MKYGYCRVSTKKQNIERQERNITAYCSKAVIFKEEYTGTTLARPEWQRLIKRVKKGDTIIFDSVSRMSRNAADGTDTYFRLMDNGINLVFLKEPYINTATYSAAAADKIKLTGGDEDAIFTGINNYFRLLAKKQIKIAFEQSEKEVQDLHERTREGLITAVRNGKTIGRKTGAKIETKKAKETKAEIQRLCKEFGGVLSDMDCIKITRVSRNTFYKYKRELWEERAKAAEKREREVKQ